MKLKSQIDLTTGTPIKCILIFALPIFIETIINILYNTVDSIIIGQIIPEQFAGISDTSNLIAIATFFVGACATGFGALVGYHFGAKDKRATQSTIAKSITLSLIIGSILALIMVSLLNPLLKMLNLSPDIDYNTYHTAQCYAFIIFICLPITVLSSTIIGCLRNIGDSVFPLSTSIISGLLNALLTFIFVFYVEDIYWKVRFAAIATIFSQLFKLVICFIYASKKYDSFHFQKKDFLLDQKTTKRLLANSIPIGLEWAIIGLGLFFISGAIISFDNAESIIVGHHVSDAQNAFGGAAQIKSFMFAFAGAISAATLSFTSQNYGAKKYKRLKESCKQIDLLTTISYIVIFGLIMLLTIKGAFLYIFIDANYITEQTITYAFYIILCYGSFSIFKYFNDNYNKVLIGLGKPFVPSIIGFVELAIRLFMVLVLRNALNDPNSLFAFIIVIGAEPFSWVASCTISTISGKKALSKLPNENYELEAK